jgi:hypothetical protein
VIVSLWLNVSLACLLRSSCARRALSDYGEGSFVDLYKVGRVNYLPLTKTTDWRDYTLRMVDLLKEVGADHYIKQDLQKYLTAGYHNPLRQQQHH